MEITIKLMFFVVLIAWAHAITCPPSADLSPCYCTEFFTPNKASLWCVNLNLDDAKMGEILDNYIAAGDSVSPLEVLYLDSNQLTRVPNQIARFPSVFYVNLEKNRISSIASGSFNFGAEIPPIRLFLGYNKLLSIEAGAFQGSYGKDSFVYLYTNDLTRFESDVFKPMIQQIAPYSPTYGWVSIYANPIDCETDFCHLAWLIRDNRDLLPAVAAGVCSNGTAFEDLNPDGYKSCP